MKLFTLLTVLFLTALCAQPPAANSFAVSDVYSILPDGRCNEIVGGEFGDLAERNSHWQRETRTISFWGARNEEVAVQIILPGPRQGCRAAISDLSGPQVIPADRVTFSTVIWVKHARLGFCPDLVIPLNGSINGTSQFDIPVAIPGLPQPRNAVGVLLCEIWIPATAAAGVYEGELRVLCADQPAEVFRVRLTVYDFTLPDSPTLAFGFLSYGLPSKALGLETVINNPPGSAQPARLIPANLKQVDYQVFRLALDNRCFVDVLPYHSQRGSPRYAYPVTGVAAAARISSYAEWDDFFAPLLDGRLNKFRQPPPYFTLPFNINYPYRGESDPEKQFDFRPFKDSVPAAPGQNAQLAEFEQTFRAVARQYVQHFSQKGWIRTHFEIYFNQKPNPGRNRSPWKLDEPTEESDYRGLRYLFQVADWAFASAAENGIQIVNRLDIGHFNCDKFLTPEGDATRCYKSKAFNRGDADRYLKGLVTLWDIGTSHVEGAQHLLADYAGNGVEIFNYGTPGTSEAIGGHYGSFAGEGFRAARIGLSGRYLFKLGLESADPNNVEEGSYESNCLYSGKSVGFPGALPSHRLKLWRRAVNDYDYITLARNKNITATDMIIKQMTRVGPATDPKYRQQSNSRGYWFTNNVEDLQAARTALANIITGGKMAGTAIRGFSEHFTPCGAVDQIIGYD